MMSAEDLFCDGKFPFFDGGSEVSHWSEKHPPLEDGASGATVQGGQSELGAFKSNLPTSDGELGQIVMSPGKRNQAGALYHLAKSEELIVSSKPLDPTATTGSEGMASLPVLKTREKPCTFKSPANKEKLTNSLHKTKAAPSAGEAERLFPQNPDERMTRGEEPLPLKKPTDGSLKGKGKRLAVQKLELRSNGDNREVTIGKEDLVPADNLDHESHFFEIRFTAHSEKLVRAQERPDRRSMLTEAIMRGESKVSTRTCLKPTSSVPTAKSEDSRVAVQWREEIRRSRKTNEKDNALQSRKFDRNPRPPSMPSAAGRMSASMTSIAVEGFSRLANRSCVSLDSSQCSSPTRSFSVPATLPTSPTASGSSSEFFSWSTTSKYRDKIKIFFKTKFKIASNKAGFDASNISSNRFSFLPNSFIPIFKTKEGSTKTSNSTSTLLQQPKGKDDPRSKDMKTIATSQAQICALLHDLDDCTNLKGCDTRLATKWDSIAASQSVPSLACEAKAATADRVHVISTIRARESQSEMRDINTLPSETLVLGDDKQLCTDTGGAYPNHSKKNDLYIQIPGKQCKPKYFEEDRGRNMMPVNSRGNLVRLDSLERPIPCAAGVRVTPVLNIPSWITPSLKKGKSCSRHKILSLNGFFPESTAK
ncbi:hypothetical protein KP509_10G017600 [Ceratopteris richardii]|nr:hypothetical protein KP509_10G017600 [Ceratopteris richardii]